MRAALASVAAWTLVGTAGCGGGAPPPPNVLLVVMDTLRADRLGCYGNERGLTPFLDELCRESTVFENAYAVSSWTLPSVASLLTSRYWVQHGVGHFDSRLGAPEVTLTERLADAGYRTIGFSANVLVQIRRGYAQGFVHWQTLAGPSPYEGATPKLPASELSLRALRRLDRVWRPDDAPAFLYLQFMDAHSPYSPPEPFRSRFAGDVPEALADSANRDLVSLHTDRLDEQEIAAAEALYDGEVAALDAALRELFANLRGRGFLERAVVVVTADHGEEFGGHGRLLHGHTLYEAAVRVPLLVQAPGIRPGRVASPVSLVDLAPTIVELAGLEPDSHFEGRSLVPWLTPAATLDRLRRLAGRGATDREEVILELPQKGAQYFDLRAHELGLVRGDRKLLVGPHGEGSVYDLVGDPGETRPVESGAEGAELRKELDAVRDDLATRAAPERHRVELDDATRQELRELGYLR